MVFAISSSLLFVGHAYQYIEPEALCAAGSDYVRNRLREERSFAKQRSGRGWRCVDLT